MEGNQKTAQQNQERVDELDKLLTEEKQLHSDSLRAAKVNSNCVMFAVNEVL